MGEAGTLALREVFAAELESQGLALPPDERDLILSVCVSRYLADVDAARSA
jgi:hypothetical protein